MSELIYTRPSLTADAAQLLIQGAVAKAVDLGVPQCVTVVDDAGDLIAFHRMDGARLMSIASSQTKARAAARTGAHTGPLPDHLGISVALASGGQFTELRGGRVVVTDGVCIGAIGVGSGTPDQDEAVAEAALEFLEDRR